MPLIFSKYLLLMVYIVLGVLITETDKHKQQVPSKIQPTFFVLFILPFRSIAKGYGD